MPIEFRNPSTVAKPASRYSHNAIVPAGARWLHVSGQVGAAPDGTVAADFAGQADQVMRNLTACLVDAGMGWGDVVKLNAFLCRQSDVPAWRELRVKHMGHAAPASTLLVVAGLASPQYLIEVEVIAAKA